MTRLPDTRLVRDRFSPSSNHATERDFFIDKPLVRIHYIIEMIWWAGLEPWELKFPFPGSLISAFLGRVGILMQTATGYRR